MTALTAADLAYLRSEVGTSPDDTDLQARYDRLGSLTRVAAEVVSGKLAAYESDPSSYTIPGVISESFDATIRALTERSKRLNAAALRDQQAQQATVTDDGDGVARIIRSDRAR